VSKTFQNDTSQYYLLLERLFTSDNFYIEQRNSLNGRMYRKRVEMSRGKIQELDEKGGTIKNEQIIFSY
jgi:hypothetical protein